MKNEIYPQTQNGTIPATSDNNVRSMGKVPKQKPRKPNRILFPNNNEQKHIRNTCKIAFTNSQEVGETPKP
jgi:hypothetical protein